MINKNWFETKQISCPNIGKDNSYEVTDNRHKITFVTKLDRDKIYEDFIVDGLETLPELYNRTHSFLDEIKEKYMGKNILLVTHGAVARSIQFYFEPMPEDGMLLKVNGQKNCQIKEYEL